MVSMVLWAVMLILSTSSLGMIWRIYRQLSGPKVSIGDVVLYTNPSEEKHHLNNMITKVLDLFPRNGTVLIVGKGNDLDGFTTAVVSRRHLTLLPLIRNAPLHVPAIPSVRRGADEDRWTIIPLDWTSIPLDWFK